MKHSARDLVTAIFTDDYPISIEEAQEEPISVPRPVAEKQIPQPNGKDHKVELELAGNTTRASDDADNAARVLFVATSLGEGGIERHSVKLAAKLADRGIEVAYLCAPNAPVERMSKAAGIHTEVVVSHNSLDFRAAREIADCIEKFRADIVHVHSRRDFVPAVAAVYLARRKRGKRSPRLILHSHLDKPLGSPPRLSRRLFASIADIVIAVSEAVQQRLIAEHGFAASFVRVLYNGIDLDTYLPPDALSVQLRRTAARQDLGIPHDAVVIGMVGRLSAKGQAVLLKSAAPLLRRKQSLWVVMVGPEGLRGEMDRLRETTSTEGISSRVIMTGPRNDVPDILPAFDLLAHLPENESFGLALVEAMASSIPTLSTNVGGCKEVVENNISGLVVPFGDTSALNDALKRLIMNDNSVELRERMGTEGRRIACERFSLDRQVDRLTQWYGDLIELDAEPAKAHL